MRACGDADEARDHALIGDEDPDTLSTREQSIQDYADPPRCSPRNCVAMCATCFYDICRIDGGTGCRAEARACADDCRSGH